MREWFVALLFSISFGKNLCVGINKKKYKHFPRKNLPLFYLNQHFISIVIQFVVKKFVHENIDMCVGKEVEKIEVHGMRVHLALEQLIQLTGIK